MYAICRLQPRQCRCTCGISRKSPCKGNLAKKMGRWCEACLSTVMVDLVAVNTCVWSRLIIWQASFYLDSIESIFGT